MTIYLLLSLLSAPMVLLVSVSSRSPPTPDTALLSPALRRLYSGETSSRLWPGQTSAALPRLTDASQASQLFALMVSVCAWNLPK